MLMKNIHVRLLIGRDFMYASIMAESVLNSSLERTSGKIIIVATVGIMRSHLNCKNVFSISPPIVCKRRDNEYSYEHVKNRHQEKDFSILKLRRFLYYL